MALLPRNKLAPAVSFEVDAVNSHFLASHVVLVIVDSSVAGEAGLFKSFDGHAASRLRSNKWASGREAEGRDHWCSNVVFHVVSARRIAL